MYQLTSNGEWMIWHHLVLSLAARADNPHLLLYSLAFRDISLADFVSSLFPLIKEIKSKRMRWALHLAHVGKNRMCAEVWKENLKEKDHLEHAGFDGNIIPKRIFKKRCGKSWTGIFWLSTGTSVVLQWTRWWEVVFLKMGKISWLAENIFDFQEGLCFVELAT
jgi:hypothetical protein